jgi:hypothetical protein
MSGMRISTILPAVILTVGLVCSLRAESNSIAGSWKLNSAKSKFGLSAAPKSASLTFEVQTVTLKTSYSETEGDDTHLEYSYDATADDGKDYPISGAGAKSLLSGADSVSLRHSGANAYAVLFKKAGQVVMTSRMVLSKDGKLLTMTFNGVDAAGQPASSVIVWDKQ